jgi:hypothetical protein
MFVKMGLSDQSCESDLPSTYSLPLAEPNRPDPSKLGVINSLLLDVFNEQASIRPPLDGIPQYSRLGERAPQQRGGVRRRQFQ